MGAPSLRKRISHGFINVPDSQQRPVLPESLWSCNRKGEYGFILC